MSEASRGTPQGVGADGVHGGAPLVLRGVSRSYRSGDTDLHVLRGAERQKLEEVCDRFQFQLLVAPGMNPESVRK